MIKLTEGSKWELVTAIFILGFIPLFFLFVPNQVLLLDDAAMISESWSGVEGICIHVNNRIAICISLFNTLKNYFSEFKTENVTLVPVNMQLPQTHVGD